MQKWWRFGDLNSSSYSSGDERDVDDNALLNVEGNAGPGLLAEAFHGHGDGIGAGVERRGPIFSRRAGLSSEAQAGVRSLDFDRRGGDRATGRIGDGAKDDSCIDLPPKETGEKGEEEQREQAGREKGSLFHLG